MSEHTLVTLGVVGGTGKEGAGLAARWARSGYRVVLGSRDAAKAQQKAEELNSTLGSGIVSGADNLSAVQQADIVVISVPYEAHSATLTGLRDALQGKIVVDITVPLEPPNIRSVNLPAGLSACLEAQTLLGADVRVVAAFQNVSYTHLQESDHPVECDVLVCGDDVTAKDEVIKLAEAAGMKGYDAGALVNSIAVESLTPVIMYMNRKYKVKGVGIKVTGIEQAK